MYLVMEKKKFSAIGRIARRKDGFTKVTGQEIFSSDIYLPNMLYARVLRSPYPHVKILSINTSKAEKMGAVCIIPDEVPQKRYNERQVSIPAKTYKDRTVLPHKVRHVGEGFVAVAHKTEALDEKAIRAINVEYEVLPAYTLSAIGNSSLRHIFYLVELVARSSSQILLFWKQARQFSYLWVY